MDIKESPAGKVVKSLTGYYSFIPNPLPPTLSWDTALATSLSQANHALGMLALEGKKLPNPHLFIRPFITKEAVLSSKIEGTRTSMSEVFVQEAGATTKPDDDLQEVKNYITALDYGIDRLKEFPLSLRFIRELHEKLMQGVRGSHATPGAFRTSQNWIGSPGSTLMNAKYVPPLPESLGQCLADFETFLYDRTLPPLIHIALCHYQFEAIHPFLDGNGRTGRLLITFLLQIHNLLPAPLLYLSAFFEQTRNEYYRQLYNVSSTGSWETWCLYFLHGVTVQSIDVLSRAERINTLITNWEMQAQTQNVAQAIIKKLAANPFCTTKKMAEDLGVAFTTAQRAIKKLEDAGILIRVTEKKRDSIYCAKAMLDILEEPTQTGHTNLIG